jgi:hypothetical protein
MTSATALTLKRLDELAGDLRHTDDMLEHFYEELNRLDLQLSDGFWSGDDDDGFWSSIRLLLRHQYVFFPYTYLFI